MRPGYLKKMFGDDNTVFAKALTYRSKELVKLPTLKPQTLKLPVAAPKKLQLPSSFKVPATSPLGKMAAFIAKLPHAVIAKVTGTGIAKQATEKNIVTRIPQNQNAKEVKQAHQVHQRDRAKL